MAHFATFSVPLLPLLNTSFFLDCVCVCFGHSNRYFNNFPEPRVLSPDVLLPSAAAVDVEDGELMYLELQVMMDRPSGKSMGAGTERVL